MQIISLADRACEIKPNFLWKIKEKFKTSSAAVATGALFFTTICPTSADDKLKIFFLLFH